MVQPHSLEGRCGDCLLFGAIEGLADGLVLADPQGRIFHLNRRAEEVLGVSARGAQRRPLGGQIRHPELRSFWAAAAREGSPATAEIALSPGTVYRVTATPCVSAAGEPIGRALLLRDITRERRIRVELSEAVARRLVGMAGGEGSPADLPALTRRELQVLRLLASGAANAVIARSLRISAGTVASHLKHLYRKLEVQNRAQAAAWALNHGIRPHEPD